MSQLRNKYLLISDAIFLSLSPFAAYALRFEGFSWSPEDSLAAIVYTALAVPGKLALLGWLGLYSRLWSQASVADMVRIIQAAVLSAVMSLIMGGLLLPLTDVTAVSVPVSVVFLDSFFTISVLAFPRMLIRAVGGGVARFGVEEGKRTLIVGAGSAGATILRELNANPGLGLRPVGFADDDPDKLHRRLSDLPVYGSLSKIRDIVEREEIEEIVIAMPTAPGTAIRKVLRAAMDVDVPARTAPGLSDILSGKVGVSSLRNVQIEDLLRREPVETDIEAVSSIARSKTVLVTGAGGSIGSELCRQLARLGPDQLVLLGHAENEIFDITRELQDEHRHLDLIPVIADVRDMDRIRSVFDEFKPYAVLHAAAHKHVPLMEAHPVEAITNNVLGTKNVVEAAAAYGTQHFVLISTDKAVRPTSVMGASKRAAEIVVHEAALKYGRHFLSVRFGNVLGSKGSVVPTFRRQIEARHPITITHPGMRRYFMTIPEAVQLVLQAAVMGQGGEVFVLDMGEPVRILDLANDLIRLSGLEVGKDIEIRFTGMRPGERLNEEVFFRGEDVLPTGHEKIRCARNGHGFSDFENRLDSLIATAKGGYAQEELRELLRSVVPEFRSPDETADQATAETPPATSVGDVGVSSETERRSGAERRSLDRRCTGADAGSLEQRRVERREVGDRRGGVDRRVNGGVPAIPVERAASE